MKTKQRKLYPRGKLIHGHGINDYYDRVKINNKHITSYEKWRNILSRCYSERDLARFPKYRGCTVCDDWLYFSKFKEWFDKNSVDGYHIDKDILVKGNKIYSHETCVFVPPEINILIIKSDSVRGIYPVGVYFEKESGKYKAQLSTERGRINLGRFKTPEEAFLAYKKAKEEHVRSIAQEYFDSGRICERAYNALIKYEVDIND